MSLIAIRFCLTNKMKKVMKYLVITKEKFEAMVPVMRDATEGVWTGVQAGLEAAEDALADVVGADMMGELSQDVLYLNDMRLVVALGGARRSLRSPVRTAYVSRLRYCRRRMEWISAHVDYGNPL